MVLFVRLTLGHARWHTSMILRLWQAYLGSAQVAFTAQPCVDGFSKAEQPTSAPSFPRIGPLFLRRPAGRQPPTCLRHVHWPELSWIAWPGGARKYIACIALIACGTLVMRAKVVTTSLAAVRRGNRAAARGKHPRGSHYRHRCFPDAPLLWLGAHPPRRAMSRDHRPRCEAQIQEGL